MAHTNSSPTDGEALFGRWLKKRRQSLGLSQKAFAAHVDCSVAMVRKIEAEERRPSVDLANRLAEFLDVAMDERQAFVEFARGGWSDLPPRATVAMQERPWLRRSERPPVPSGPSFERSFLSAPPELVARTSELTRLEAHLNRALAGQTQVVLVRGEAGQGKTVLLQAFAHAARRDHPELLLAWGSCNAHTGPGDPYLPFREILQLLAGDAATLASVAHAGPDLIGTFLPERPSLTMLEAHAPDGSRLARSLAASARDGAGGLVPLQSAALMAQYLAVISTLAHDRPLLLILDDLHWIDTASTDLLLHLTKQLTGSPILLLGAYRGVEVAHGRGEGRHPLAAVINELRREHGDAILDLDHGAHREFIDAWLDMEPNHLSGDFRDALLRQTGGHPLFTIELVRAMQERGDLVRDENDHWIAPPEISWTTLPARVEGVIDERLGRLAPELAEWLKVAAVEGEAFTAEVVSHVLDIPARDVARGLSSELSGTHRLIAAQDVQRRQGVGIARYRFRHNLIQRRMYEALDTVERAYLHEAVAEALAILHARRIDEVAIQLAQHFLAAGAPGRAAVHLRQAGRNARHAGALDEAIRYYGQALEHWPEGDASPTLARARTDDGPTHRAMEDGTTRQRAAIEHELGECQWLRGHKEEARATLARAFERYESLGDAEGAAAVERRIELVDQGLGMPRKSLEDYQASLEVLKERPESRDLAWTLSWISRMHMISSEYDLAVSSGERALELARRLDAKDVIAHALNNIGTSLLHGFPRRFDEGRAYIQESKALALDLGLPEDVGRAMSNLADVSWVHGRANEARDLLHELLLYKERLGFRGPMRYLRYQLFNVEQRCGRWREAFTSSVWTEHSTTDSIPRDFIGMHASIHFATAHTDLGEPQVALELLDETRDAVWNQGDLHQVLPYLGERIRASAALGHASDVEQDIDRLLEALAAAPFTEHSAQRGLLAACQWLGARRERHQHERLASCASELHRLECQYETRNMTAAAREGDGWLALLAGRSSEAAEHFEDAERQWRELGFPLDRIRTLDGSHKALQRSGRTADATRVFDAANELVSSLATQLDDSDLGERMARVWRGRLINDA